MKKIITISVLTATALSVTGCAPRIGASDYSIRGAGEVSNTERGVIVNARPVNISASSTAQDNQPGVGAAIGAVTGLAAGNQFGRGRGNAVATGVGAIAGGVAGHLIGQKLTDQQGFEYQVQLDSGRLVTISQGAEPAMRPGQRVLVISSNRDRGRVVPDQSGY